MGPMADINSRNLPNDAISMATNGGGIWLVYLPTSSSYMIFSTASEQPSTSRSEIR